MGAAGQHQPDSPVRILVVEQLQHVQQPAEERQSLGVVEFHQHLVQAVEDHHAGPRGEPGREGLPRVA